MHTRTHTHVDGALLTRRRRQVFTFGAGPGCRAVLVRLSRRRTVDALGRVTEVCTALRLAPSLSPHSLSL